MANPRQRVDQEPGFILHAFPYRETSLIVEALTRNHGRVALMAKGARRPHSTLRGQLMAFQPLWLDWSGGGELKNLMRVDWQGGQPLLTGRALLCGYYLNELLLKLIAREDAHPTLFEGYGDALRDLAQGVATEPLLRRFELRLLRELGYGLDLEFEAVTGAPIRAEGAYVSDIERGLVSVGAEAGGGGALPGRVLRNMAREAFDEPETQQHAKVLLRRLLNHYLGGQPLQSRRVFMELQEL
ncbi:MAG: DNA repair protein RecO [Zoogloeaceae bacterium]|nr:DNA repair protein RecO [Zoogloeaceae bacterium]